MQQAWRLATSVEQISDSSDPTRNFICAYYPNIFAHQGLPLWISHYVAAPFWLYTVYTYIVPFSFSGVSLLCSRFELFPKISNFQGCRLAHLETTKQAFEGSRLICYLLENLHGSLLLQVLPILHCYLIYTTESSIKPHPCAACLIIPVITTSVGQVSAFETYQPSPGNWQLFQFFIPEQPGLDIW